MDFENLKKNTMETNPTLKTKKRKFRIARIIAIILLAGALLLGAMEVWIRLEANYYANSAVKKFRLGKIPSLVAMIGSSDYTLKQKNMAIWALGELKGKEALPELESLLTGRPCNHQTEVCQYEVKKAIHKIKGTSRWSLNYKTLKDVKE